MLSASESAAMLMKGLGRHHAPGVSDVLQQLLPERQHFHGAIILSSSTPETAKGYAAITNYKNAVAAVNGPRIELAR